MIKSINYSKYVTKEQLIDILDLAAKEQITERAASERILGYIHYDLRKYKDKYGIEKNFNHRVYSKKYKINDDFFTVPNLKNCYWAGFIAADGNIAKINNALTITLSEKDSEQLERFLEDTCSNYPIHRFNQGEHQFCTIHTVSQKMADDLKTNFNIIPTKSLILESPNIDWSNKDLVDAYIIGLIDGDGTIGFSASNKTQPHFYISIIGTKQILTFVKNRFEEILERPTSNLHHEARYKENTWTIRISDLAARQLFIHFYNIQVRKMYRKWSDENYRYCINFKKALPKCRRKGVKIFNLNGDMIKEVETLAEAEAFTGTSYATISKLCKIDDNRHMSRGYMFSRTKDKMDPYFPAHGTNIKYLDNLNHEGKELDAGIENIEDNA